MIYLYILYDMDGTDLAQSGSSTNFCWIFKMDLNKLFLNYFKMYQKFFKNIQLISKINIC